ncbi:unnamed protein product [Strongylus vulgaris]|uniref:TIMELESS-interacting protein n=1 Tax=Strongylus vulgaris TaxID=40348 RepID=A0A3P7JMZ8_STRVU|nr:unnamed protein product [Strongylus vulgaris]
MGEEFDEINDFLGNDFYDDEPPVDNGNETSDDHVLNSLIEKENKEAVKKQEFDEINDFLGNDFYDEEPPVDNENETSDDHVLNSLIEKENKEAVKKRNKTRPQPKLNEATITGPKGIQALRESFKNYKPDPSKDPYENLSVMLKKYEHWAHVMFPKLKFEDVVSRCEALGERRIVKVYMTKSRLDMPLTDDDFAPHRRKNDQIIDDAENAESTSINRREDSEEDDENYYDPLESTSVKDKTNNSENNVGSPAKSVPASSTTQEVDIDDDMLEAANEVARHALEEEQRRREEAELAMADEIMEDFDMY